MCMFVISIFFLIGSKFLKNVGFFVGVCDTIGGKDKYRVFVDLEFFLPKHCVTHLHSEKFSSKFKYKSVRGFRRFL